jgi:multicopper oxidase
MSSSASSSSFHSSDSSRLPRVLSRRRVLRAGGVLALLGAAAACGGPAQSSGGSGSGPVDPHSAVVARAESARRRPNAPVRKVALSPRVVQVDLGGPKVHTWAYGDQVPGPLIRATAGDVLQVQVRNELPSRTVTTVHWHGITIRNDMDGVPQVTQNEIASGQQMTYEFTVADAGSYWYHPHVGVQFDHGLYGPLIVDDPTESGDYDVEFVVVLDDWVDGTGRTPEQILTNLQKGMAGMATPGSSAPMPSMAGMPGMTGSSMSGSGGMNGMDMTSALLGGDAGDVRYPYYLVGGRVATAPVTYTAKPGQRARIRLVNAGGDTTFRVALGGHRMTVTHTDGYPVAPVTVDTLLIGMGERYDVEVTLADGVFPLVASAEGKFAQGMALVRTGSGSAPAPTVHPTELDGRMLALADLHATDAVALPARTPDRTLTATLGGDMATYVWTINGRTFGNYLPLDVRQGEHVQLTYTNTTSMYHPMHLHGHTFQVRTPRGPGPRKDTVIVLPGQSVTVDLLADNPGQWVTHCHNIYHEVAGMMTVMSYRS